ncbi:putative reverse transcriptase domain, reverse transcriptase zinc-binding domain protein [Tanacetum coccineum]
MEIVQEDEEEKDTWMVGMMFKALKVFDPIFRDAMFAMGDNKAPGPDRYTAAFFKEAWDVLASDVNKAIKEFFTNEVLLKELNHTIIALILYRIISDRMKDSLTDLVNLNQSVFAPERRISDNILLTQELMHNYHLDRGTPRCAFKVDVQKAYDTVDWKFLHDVLIRYGFHPRMIGWIMECVTSTSFSISINGSLHGYFKGKRGLRQGDSMSPYLFTLVMEVLTLMLHRRARVSGEFTYRRYCSKLNLINLCFADDLFQFSHGDVDSARVIMDSLEEFKEASGLTPSLPKSTTYFCNVLNYTKLDILNILSFEEGKLPVKYLGVPLVPSRLLYRDCKELMEKVKGQINDWKNKSLSLAGEIRKGRAKVAWEVVCLPKREGGLGIRRLEVFNQALITSHIWSLLSHKESLWVKLISSYKLNGHSFWEIPLWVWEHLKCFTGFPNIPSKLDAIVDFISPLAKMRSARSVISKLVFAASCYFIWQERNNRLFMKKKRSKDQVIDVIKSTVRLKLISCRFKKTVKVHMLSHLWELPKSCIYG